MKYHLILLSILKTINVISLKFSKCKRKTTEYLYPPEVVQLKHLQTLGTVEKEEVVATLRKNVFERRNGRICLKSKVPIWDSRFPADFLGFSRKKTQDFTGDEEL